MSQFGIQELYCPLTDIQVDIVAVHGINGDAHHTWTTTPSNICWLSHPALLPNFINNARILTWGYNASVTSRKGRGTSADRILQHAQTLVAQLHADRELEGASERPIIFVCHSLGGIVVKRALAYSASQTASKVAHLHSIYTCTYGILFFGTPHNGSSKANLFSNLQKVVSLTVPKKALETDSSLLKALEEDSEVLQNITDQFAPLLHRFRIFFFWEQERTDLKYTKDYVVDQSSAAPILDDTERSGIAADHRGICRFERRNSPGFRTVAAALKRYCKDAPDVIRARQKTASETLSTRRWNEASELLRDGRAQSVVQGSGSLCDHADRRLQSAGGEEGSGFLTDHAEGRIQSVIRSLGVSN